MKQFHYKAYDEEGGIHEGSLAARTKREAAAALFSEGLSVIRLFEEKEAHQFFRARPFASRRALSLLASSWAALLSAGLTVTESLSLLASKESPQERRLLLTARERIASGHSLSESFAAGGWCPSFFISLLEVGEMTGTLPSALTHIALYYEKEDLFRRRLSRSLAYPLFVLAFALVLLLVILLFILPSFAMLFETLGITLPLAAQAGRALGLFLRHWGMLLCLILFAVLIAGALYLRTRAGPKGSVALPLCFLSPSAAHPIHSFAVLFPRKRKAALGSARRQHEGAGQSCSRRKGARYGEEADAGGEFCERMGEKRVLLPAPL